MRLSPRRQRNIAGYGIVIVFWAFFAAPLRAVIISDPNSVPNLGTTAPADDPGWAYVGKAFSSSCVYLGNGWALTAAHVGYFVNSGDSININGTAYTVDQTPVRLKESLTSTAPIDLSLIHINVQPPGLASLPITSVKPATGSSVTAIGWGFDQQTSPTYWDANWNEVSAAGSVHSGFKLITSSTIKRWGTNNVTADNFYGNPINAGWGNNYILYTAFNSGQVGSEFQAVTHDSGGGVFYKDSNNVWNLAGIIEAVDNPLSGQPANTALFRDSTSVLTGNTLSIDLSKYRDQIVKQVQVFQISSMLTNPSAYIGSDWTKVQLIGNGGFGSLTGNWNSIPIDTNNHTFTVDTGGTSSTLGVVISGGGGLTKNGTGTLTLSAANTFSGTTNVASGTLKLSNTYALQNSTLNYTAGTLTFDSGVSARAFTVGGLSGSKAISLKDSLNNAIALSVGNNNQNTTYSGALSSSGSLTKVGSGTLTLTGALSYTGNTTVSGGSLNVSSINAPAATISVLGTGSTLSATSIVANTLVIGAGGGASGFASALSPQSVAIVPEPSTWVLLILGLLGAIAFRWLRTFCNKTI